MAYLTAAAVIAAGPLVIAFYLLLKTARVYNLFGVEETFPAMSMAGVVLLAGVAAVRRRLGLPVRLAVLMAAVALAMCFATAWYCADYCLNGVGQSIEIQLYKW